MTSFEALLGDTSRGLESAFAGLVIAVLALLSLFLRDRLASLYAFIRHGVHAADLDMKKAANAIFVAGLIPYGFLSLWARSTGAPVPASWRMYISFPAWLCFAFGIALYGATSQATIAKKRSYLLIMMGAVMACVVGFALTKPFHGPVRASEEVTRRVIR